jgi:hypothetical protein
MSTESERHDPPEAETVICQKCLRGNPATTAFCLDCGAPIGMVAAVDPLQHIYAEGFAYRSAVEGPPNLIILAGIWLIFASILFLSALVVFGNSARGLSPRLLFLFFAACSAIILFRSTLNYIVKSREARHRKSLTMRRS